MLSPLTGLNTQIGYTLRARDGARVIMAGGEMTGVHHLRGEERPRRGFYHIGGAGLLPDEAIIRTLGETAERYAQFVAHLDLAGEIRFASAAERHLLPGDSLDPACLSVFSDGQYAVPGFPFARYASDAPIGWVRVETMPEARPVWVPAQVMLVGYGKGPDQAEAPLNLAVTTGGAAHVARELAVRNGLLELIQIDAAMGHWYSKADSYEILPSPRTSAVAAIAERLYGKSRLHPRFYLLKPAGLPGLIVACMLSRKGAPPNVAVGLGADLALEPAMYKALLEAAGVVQLAKITLVNMSLEERAASGIDPHNIADLDTNVAYYALPQNAERVREKFGTGPAVSASDVDPDGPASPEEACALLTDAIRSSGKRLYHLDLSTADVVDLGLCVHRVWSPDLITLCLPSAPPQRHPRFEDYGGFRYVGPHPYP